MAHRRLFLLYLAGKDKASKAAKAVKKSQWKKSLKPRYSVVFHRPRTLVRSRDPKVPRVRCVIIQHSGNYIPFGEIDCTILGRRRRGELELEGRTATN